MTIKETKLRIEPSLDDWLKAQAAIAGMAKTKYIIQALEDLRSNAGHTHPKLSPKLSLESPADVSIYAEVAALKSRVAKLEQGSTKPIQDKPQFYEGQEITGQSAKTYRLLWNSFEASQKIDGAEFHLSNKLGIACIVIGSSKAGKKKLKVVDCFQGKRIVINDDGTFLFKTKEGKLDCIYQELDPATTEATAALEPTNNETPIEVVSHPLEKPISAVELSSDEVEVDAVTEAPAAQDEPLEEVATTPQTGDSTATEIVLSRHNLAQRLAKTPNEAKTFSGTLTNLGGEKMKPTAIMNWTSKHDPEGKSWMPEDETRETWVMQPNTSAAITAN